MKVILLKEVPDLGDQDNLVDVSEGYARNYLFPRKLAGQATPKAIAELEKRKEEVEQQLAAKRAGLEELAKKIAELEIVIPADTGEGGKLFGSITTQDVAIGLSKELGIEIDKRKIVLGETIKLVGEYPVLVKLYREINAHLKIKVVTK
jgi:large subunit ribosomal protein L9